VSERMPNSGVPLSGHILNSSFTSMCTGVPEMSSSRRSVIMSNATVGLSSHRVSFGHLGQKDTPHAGPGVLL